jgi:hypothetical protein
MGLEYSRSLKRVWLKYVPGPLCVVPVVTEVPGPLFPRRGSEPAVVVRRGRHPHTRSRIDCLMLAVSIACVDRGRPQNHVGGMLSPGRPLHAGNGRQREKCDG